MKQERSYPRLTVTPKAEHSAKKVIRGFTAKK